MQERVKQLEKLPRIEIPESLKKIRFSFPSAPHSGKIVLRLEKIGKAYGDHSVLCGIDATVEHSDRLVVTGRNGAGKTTLLRILAGEDTAYDGRLVLGANVSIGYFSQDSAEKINGNLSVIDMLEKEAPLDLVPKLRDMLAAFLFRGDDIFKTIDVLSGGEKSRLAMLRLLLKPANLLILDEPTNHLDIHSKDALLAALQSFGGTIVFISHDRSFTQALATRILELNAGHCRLYPGPYDYYLEQQKKQAAFNTDAGFSASGGAVAGTHGGASDAAAEKVRDAKTVNIPPSYAEQKRLQSQRRKLEKEERLLMEQITQAEEQKALLEAELAKPEVYSDGEKSRSVQQRIHKLDGDILQLSEKWEKALGELEEFLNGQPSFAS